MRNHSSIYLFLYSTNTLLKQNKFFFTVRSIINQGLPRINLKTSLHPADPDETTKKTIYVSQYPLLKEK